MPRFEASARIRSSDAAPAVDDGGFRVSGCLRRAVRSYLDRSGHPQLAMAVSRNRILPSARAGSDWCSSPARRPAPSRTRSAEPARCRTGSGRRALARRRSLGQDRFRRNAFQQSPSSVYYSGAFWVKISALLPALVFTFTLRRKVTFGESAMRPVSSRPVFSAENSLPHNCRVGTQDSMRHNLQSEQ